MDPRVGGRPFARVQRRRSDVHVGATAALHIAARRVGCAACADLHRGAQSRRFARDERLRRAAESVVATGEVRERAETVYFKSFRRLFFLTEIIRAIRGDY